MLVTYEDWLKMSGGSLSIADALAGTIETAEIEFDLSPDRSLATGASFD